MDEVNRIFEEQVVGQGRFEALDQVYTRDALILPPGGEAVQGLEAIRAFWQQAARSLGVTACRLRPFETTILGEMACEVARGRSSPAAPPSPSSMSFCGNAGMAAGNGTATSGTPPPEAAAAWHRVEGMG
ncbi:YybH family protein [Teichococcus aestuarii]|uniref:YybH family protein n=1 Tax=Teichococcus aestuarii TaxID=568898 RepID=UPI00361C00F2